MWNIDYCETTKYLYFLYIDCITTRKYQETVISQ